MVPKGRCAVLARQGREDEVFVCGECSKVDIYRVVEMVNAAMVSVLL